MPALRARKAKTKCPKTGKMRWLSRVDAQMALANIASKPGSKGHRSAGGPQEGRSYRCPYCSSWHTTHQPLRTQPKENGDQHRGSRSEAAVPRGDSQELAG